MTRFNWDNARREPPMGGRITPTRQRKKNLNALSLEYTFKRLNAYLNAIPDKTDMISANTIRKILSETRWKEEK